MKDPAGRTRADLQIARPQDLHDPTFKHIQRQGRVPVHRHELVPLQPVPWQVSRPDNNSLPLKAAKTYQTQGVQDNS